MGLKEDLQRSFESLNPMLPDTYASRKAVVGEAYGEFRKWAASVLQGPLWDKVQSMPQATYEEHKALARWINQECRLFGLAVRCPNTGKPSLLMATKIGGRRGVGAFVFETVGERGRKTSSSYRSQLRELALVPDSEERRNWAEYMRQRTEEPGRKGQDR